MASNWISVSTQLGYPKPGNVDDSALIPVGTVAQFRDIGTTFLGTGEFIYLEGAASTVLGTVVTYNVSTGVAAVGATTLGATSMANDGCPLAFATAAIVDGKYGWYQIGGAAIAACTGDITAGAPVFLGAAVLSGTPAAGLQVLNAVAGSDDDVPSTDKVIVTIDRPHLQGQDADTP